MTTTSTTAPGNIRALFINHPISSYVILTYLLTWLFTIPFVYCYNVVLDQSFELWLLIFLPGAYGPTIAALIVTYIQEGAGSVKRLLSKLAIWKVNWKWYVFIFLIPSVWVSLAIACTDFGQTALQAFDLAQLMGAIPLFLAVALPFGPLAEELGWRGYALPRLQNKYSVLTSSLILGVIWTFWHTPMFWFPGAAIPSFMGLSLFSVVLYLLQVVALSIIFSIVFNNTKGSVLIAIIFHTTFNAAENIIFAATTEPNNAQEQEIYYWTIALMWIIAILCLVFIKTKQVIRHPY